MYSSRIHKGKVFLLMLLLVGGFVVYDQLRTNKAEAQGGLTSSDPDSEESVGKELLVLTDRIQSIKLDGSFFQDQAFMNLQDFTVELVPEATGRTNPFAPISGVAPSQATTTRSTAANARTR